MALEESCGASRGCGCRKLIPGCTFLVDIAVFSISKTKKKLVLGYFFERNRLFFIKNIIF
jgi:hypothetical protein